MTGRNLKRLRLVADIRATDVARTLGVDRSRVSQIEAAPDVSQAVVDRYIGALVTIRAERTQ